MDRVKPAASLSADDAAYFRLCAGLGKRPGESLADAAARALRRTRGRRHMAARALLVAGDPWASIRGADRILRGVGP
jgi:hypothetical protein